MAASALAAQLPLSAQQAQLLGTAYHSSRAPLQGGEHFEGAFDCGAVFTPDGVFLPAKVRDVRMLLQPRVMHWPCTFPDTARLACLLSHAPALGLSGAVKGKLASRLGRPGAESERGNCRA